MKSYELSGEMEKILKENNINIRDCFQSIWTQRRLIGLAYGEFTYTKKCKELPILYTSEQIIECTEFAVPYIQKTKNFTDKDTERSIVNAVLCAVTNQLKWNYLGDDITKEEIESIDV